MYCSWEKYLFFCFDSLSASADRISDDIPSIEYLSLTLRRKGRKNPENLFHVSIFQTWSCDAFLELGFRHRGRSKKEYLHRNHCSRFLDQVKKAPWFSFVIQIKVCILWKLGMRNLLFRLWEYNNPEKLRKTVCIFYPPIVWNSILII